ncbi:MAG TPA: peptidase M1, partial [Bacteroidales bacterium]|nr:peptidase M1 [Bacteroidales bacterium]
MVTGEQIENFLSEKTGINLQRFFDQYLRDVRIPVFEYYVKGEELTYRWNNCVRGFDMPLKIFVSGKALNINPKQMFST